VNSNQRTSKQVILFFLFSISLNYIANPTLTDNLILGFQDAQEKKKNTTKLKAHIVSLFEAGMTKTTSAHKFGMARQTVSRIIAQFSERQTVVLAPKLGKPWKTGDQDLFQLGKLLKANPQTLRQLNGNHC
jgi:DNA-binding XRE family transcriptional regulator